MINASYKRDMYHHFLLINESNNKKEMGFELQMLLNNNIKGVLRFELRRVDDKNEYCYDITDKSPLTEIYEKNNLNYKQIKHLVFEIISSIERGEEYLLRENNFVLQPEYIYINADSNQPNINLCYLPYYDKSIKEQMNGLIEYLMNKVDYMDEKAVVLIYGLYKLSREETTTFNSLKLFIQNHHKNQVKETITPQLKQPIESKNYNQPTEKNNYSMEKNKPHINREINLRPLMQEKIQDEKEIEEYPLYIKILIPITILLGITIFTIAYKKNLLINSRTKEMDITKILGLLIVLVPGTIYTISKLLDKNNKSNKMIKVIKYTDNPSQEYEAYEKPQMPHEYAEETQLLSVPEDETVILSACTNNYESILLQSLEPDKYNDIYIENFPFIIGKLKSSTDYVLEDPSVSRVHAKIDIDTSSQNNVYFITDLGSTNGTALNNIIMKNKGSELTYGDVISIANYRYKMSIKSIDT